ncbi:MAG: DUF5011 domain-containing protein [Candidatus Kerfeldbacteria bacterium]
MKKVLMFASIAIFVLTGSLAIHNGQAKAYYSQDLVVNGGFENDPVGTGWVQQPPGSNIGVFSPIIWHGGSRGALMGRINTMDFIQQDIVVPNGITSATFSGWYALYSSEYLSRYDAYVMWAFNKNDITEEFCLIIKDPVIDGAPGTWTNLSCDVTAAQGKTMRVVVGIINDTAEQTIVLVDDVKVNIEKPDLTAPTTVLSVFPSAPNGSNSYYTAIPTITLSVSDDVGGSGVDKPFYTWDSGVLIPYAGPFAALEGTHTLSYISSDVAGNAEVTKTASFKVDATKPILTLIGSGSMTVEAGSLYSDSGVSATDNLDAVIASRISVTNAVNTAKVGTYAVTYNVSDEAGNAATAVTRTVQVVDSTKPIITILGSNPVTVDKNAVYTDAGATASDSVNGDITSKISTASTVNTAVIGDYSVTYSVTDSSGNAITAVRTVKVISKGRVLGVQTALPVITNLKQSKNKYSLVTLAGKSVKVQPFEKSYKGKIWAKRINFGEGLGSLYLFAPTDTYAKSAIKVYGPKGTLIKTVKPFGGFSTSGFNIDIVVEPLNDVVYLAVGTRKAGTTAVVYEVSSTGLKFVHSVKVGKTSGNVMVKFLKLYANQYGLVTAVNSSAQTMKVWKLNPATNKFTQDKTYSLKKLKISGDTIKLK